MIRLNLLPVELRQPEPKKFSLPPFVSPKGLLFFLAVISAAEALLFIYLKFIAEPQFAVYQKKYMGLGSDLKAVRDLKEKAAKAQEVNRQLLTWMDVGTVWSELMGQLSSGMEKGVWLTHLAFERRDFDVLAKTEDRSASSASAGGAVTANPAAAAAVANIQGRVKNLGRGKQADKEKRVVLVLRGRVATAEDHAAIIGRFIESVKNQKAVTDLIEDLRLDEIRKNPDSEVPMYDFVISGAVRRELEKEFFNLP